jgi:hypothetical protein
MKADIQAAADLLEQLSRLTPSAVAADPSAFGALTFQALIAALNLRSAAENCTD